MKLFAVIPLLAILGVQAAPTATSDQVLDNRAEKEFQARWWKPSPTHGEGWGWGHKPHPSMPVASAMPSHIPKGWGHGWGKGWKEGKGWKGKKEEKRSEQWYEKHEWA